MLSPQDQSIIQAIEKDLGKPLEIVSRDVFREFTFDEVAKYINKTKKYHFYIRDSDKVVGFVNIDTPIDCKLIQKLKDLEFLILHRNQISDISFLKELTKLSTLYLSSNEISDFSILKKFTNLSSLNLRSNKISDISFLKEFTNLSSLDLSSNEISDFSILKKFTKLSSLNLSYNKISDISFLKELTNLSSLNLSSNKITQFPKELLRLNMEVKIKQDYKGGIILEKNPIEDPPLEIVAKGREAIEEYFASLEDGEQKINELKVLIVGNGESGKTSLLKRILDKEFDPKEHQTYGIEIHSKTIEYSDREIKANFWDFGGQKIMHSTHQFFFTERSLYLLVLDGRAEEDEEYWLKHIETFGDDSPIIVLLNKIDQNPSFDVDERHLKNKYNIKGFYPISCQTDEGIDQFLKALKKEILDVDLIETKWSPKWLVIKERLEKSTNNYITHEKFEAICQEEGIKNKSTQDVLMGYLHDLGIALHFKELELLDTFVLNPIWVTEAVYKIINDPNVVLSKGRFTTAMLETILYEEKFPNHKFLFIVDVMKKFEVCYQIENRIYFIPSLFERGEPEIDFDESNALEFEIRYNFLPNSIISKFIVHRHEEIKDNKRWRTGVLLEDKELNVIALIKADLKEKIIFIKVNGSQKREYFSEIRKSFRKIHSTYEKLDLKEFLLHNHLFFEYQDLIDHERHNRKTIFKKGQDYDVRELLGGIEEPKETKEYITNHYHYYQKDTTNQHHSGSGDNTARDKNNHSTQMGRDNNAKASSSNEKNIRQEEQNESTVKPKPWYKEWLFVGSIVSVLGGAISWATLGIYVGIFTFVLIFLLMILFNPKRRFFRVALSVLGVSLTQFVTTSGRLQIENNEFLSGYISIGETSPLLGVMLIVLVIFLLWLDFKEN